MDLELFSFHTDLLFLELNFRRPSVSGPLEKSHFICLSSYAPFPFLLAPLSGGNTTNYPVHPAFLKLALFCMPGLNIDMVPHEMNEKNVNY